MLQKCKNGLFCACVASFCIVKGIKKSGSAIALPNVL